MKHPFTVILCLVLLAGCQASGVRTFWNTHSIDYSDIRAAEDQFARFAEQAVSAPEPDALEALDVLFDRLRQDTVAYYLYSEWVDGAFYSPLSPCRNAALYAKAVDRMVTDAVLQDYECRPYLQKREWILFNQPGEPAIVPGLVPFGSRTLVLVLDLGCPSCREALEALLSDPRWTDVYKVAVGLGHGPRPAVDGWDYLFPENGSAVFDIRMTPVYFVVAADGTVESGYTLAI